MAKHNEQAEINPEPAEPQKKTEQPNREENNALIVEPARLSEVAIVDGTVMPKHFGDVVTLAHYFHRAGLHPEGLQNREAVAIVLLAGLELKLSPTTAMQNIYVVNNRPTIWGDAALAVVMNHPEFDDMDPPEWEGDPKSDAYKAIFTVRRRRPSGKVLHSTRTFSWGDAVAAGLASKATYKNYRQQMLLNRARAYALRDIFPDALKGIQISDVDSNMGVSMVDAEGYYKPEVMDDDKPPRDLGDLESRLSKGRKAKTATPVQDIADPDPEPGTGEQQEMEQADTPEPKPI